MPKEAILTPGALRALEALKGTDGNITMKDLNATLEQPIGSAHLTALLRRGLVEAVEVEVPVVRVSKVNAYTVTEAGMNYVQAATE